MDFELSLEVPCCEEKIVVPLTIQFRVVIGVKNRDQQSKNLATLKADGSQIRFLGESFLSSKSEEEKNKYVSIKKNTYGKIFS